MTWHIGIMETETLTWYALGGTPQETKEACLNWWNYRQKELAYHRPGFEPTYFESIEELEQNYDIVIIELAPGQCKRYGID